MSCTNRTTKFQANIETVRILAQKTANLLQCPQLIYKTICNGAMVYKFSEKWDGKVEETIYPENSKVQFNRNNTGKNILRNSENWEQRVVESRKNTNKSK